MKAFLQILSSYIGVKKEIAVHITSSIILCRHGFMNISTKEIGKRGKRYKKYVYLYKYKFMSNRIASNIRAIKDNKRLPRVKTQN